MEFRIERDEFVRGLSRVQSIIERKSTLPVLGNVLIAATKAGLDLAATDLEVGLRGTCAASVAKPGTVTLPARRLFDIVRELPSGEVKLTRQANDWVAIEYPSGKMLLAGLPADDFPAIPTFDEKGFAVFEPDLLSDMIDKTLFAVSTDETRYYLNGVYLETGGKDKGLLRMVATDGHRLCVVERDAPAATKLGLTGGVILPRKAVGELKKLLAEKPEEVHVAIRDRNAVVRAGGTTLTIRLIDGEFPDYTRVIPTACDKAARIDRDAFAHALRRISIVSAEMTRGVKVALSADALELSAQNPSLGEAKETLPAAYAGKDLEIGFNARFFLDVLGVIAPGEVILEFSDELSPALIRAETAEGFKSVIMPMRL
jgi:DNA polymerase-3 subunit beta